MAESHSSRTARVSVIEQLRRLILAGTLPPGSRLVQAELARRLQVSVTPVREALLELKSQGLVDFDSFCGAVVHAPSLRELEEIFEVRRALLPVSVRRGLQSFSPTRRQRATDLISAMEATRDRIHWMQLNREFHQLFYSTQPNQTLLRTLESLADIVTLYINLSFIQDVAQRQASEREHRQILAAFCAGDEDRAVALNLAHINSTLVAARNGLQGSEN